MSFITYISPNSYIIPYFISRSKAEEKSRAKAMDAKAKKGVSVPGYVYVRTNEPQLLTPEEKKRWEEAQKNKDDDCIIM
jgi:hypothetical protein